MIKLRRGEEEEVCTGGRAELYTCWGAKPLAEPLTRPCPGTRPGNKHQRRHITPPLKRSKPALRLSPPSTCLHPYIVITAGRAVVVGYRLQAEQSKSVVVLQARQQGVG